MLLSDDPITDPNQDLLGRAPLLDRLHRHLQEWSYRQGLVIGVSGASGQGKTSLLRLLARRLHRGFIVADFNPWYFESEQEMVEGFLTSLARALLAEMDRSFADTAGEIMNDVRQKLSVLPPVHVFGFGLDFSKLKVGEKSLDDLWDDLSSLVESSHKRVVVLMDDLDRLPMAHLLLLVKVIRLWTVSRKMVYVLAYDGARLRGALESQLASDPEFLARVVGLELPLPSAGREALDSFWRRQLRALLSALGLAIPQAAWEPVYRDVVAPRLDSLRDAKRLLNALAFALPGTPATADPAAVLRAEAERVLAPDGDEGEPPLLQGQASA